VPSNPGHCGVCHFDFDGSGPRNPYGLAVEIAISSGDFPNDEAAIFSLHDLESDNDGFTNGVEITDTANFANTPTFPGLKTSNLGQVLNVVVTDIQDHLTPSGGTDATPPTVAVTTPSGGEAYDATSSQTIAWTATDPSGIARVDIFHSDDGGASFRPVVRNLVGLEFYVWFVPNRPGLDNLIRVTAYDGAGNAGDGDSGGAFTIAPLVGGIVPTTLRDFDLSRLCDLSRRLRPGRRAVVQLARQHDGPGHARPTVPGDHGHRGAGCARLGRSLYTLPHAERVAGGTVHRHQRRYAHRA